MEKYNLKENILMEEDGMVEAMIIMNIKILKLKMEQEKENYMIFMVTYYLKVNIQVVKKMVKEKNIIKVY